MYSYEERIKAVQLYIQYDKSAASVVHELGYPKNTKSIVLWYKEYINSDDLPRGSLNARSPYQVFEDMYGKETASKLGLKYIPLNELCLKPELIKK